MHIGAGLDDSNGPATASPAWAIMHNIRFNYNAEHRHDVRGRPGLTTSGRDLGGNGTPAVLDRPRSRTAAAIRPGQFRRRQVDRHRVRPGHTGNFDAGSPSRPRRSSPASPANKPRPASGLDGFTVAQYSAEHPGPEFDLVQLRHGDRQRRQQSRLRSRRGDIPDFEFTIDNFSKVPGINPLNGFFIQGYDGMAGSRRRGDRQDSVPAVPRTAAGGYPEPTTWLAWMLLAGGAGWRYRRRAGRRR